MLPTRARTGLLQWATILALLAAIFFAPALVAWSVTAKAEPVRFLQRPWHGWAFAATVLRASVSAEAASPGAALSRAERAWSGTARGSGAVEPVEVQLLYLPGASRARFEAVDARGNMRPVTKGSSRPLVWLVLGRPAGHTAVGVIGLLDFESGDVIWDTRTSSKDATST